MTLAADALCVTRGVTRGGAQVLRDVSAVMEPGQITAIVGPNGAGKSSLLMTLAGLLPPASGTVTLDGEDIAGLPLRSRARTMGYLPQGADIAWDVAAESIVRLGRMPHGDSQTEPVEAAIAALDLEALRRRPAGQLSGGERARVLLARVLAGQPRWILADEPLAALDLAHQLSLIRHLQATARTGVGVVIVLHDLALAMNYADRVVVLDGGKLAANEAPKHALCPRIIEQVWRIKAEWVAAPNNPGQQALITHGPF